MLRGPYWSYWFFNRQYFGGTWLRAGSAFGAAQLLTGRVYLPGLQVGVVDAGES
ncbi:MAG TPA: hypothetical protein VD932_02620 [Aquabacterium sp.]|nr:hypothetical protein [Aquabacterium sp.]